MKQYKDSISLSNNERGIWDLDTVKGCKSGIENNVGGCYGDCYAFKTANRYGIDFSKSINRNFINEAHRVSIVNAIEKIDMPFIRIGCSGDPSEDWGHTIKIIEQIRNEKQLSLFDISSSKQIVIITRHWNNLTDEQLEKLKKFNICINTSVSALDSFKLIKNSIAQYKRLKPYCKSILRIVSCEFNLSNNEGKIRNEIQKMLFRNSNTLDTVFRPSSKNKFILNDVIVTKKSKFMNSIQITSKMNKKTYIGNCKNCKEMCGLNI